MSPELVHRFGMLPPPPQQSSQLKAVQQQKTELSAKYLCNEQKTVKNLKRFVAILVVSLLIMPAHRAICGEEGIMRGMTQAHNTVRAQRGVQGLEWSDELAAIAQEWADYLARTKGCAIVHRKQQGEAAATPIGENLYWASALIASDGTRTLQQITPERVVQKWAAEAHSYSYEQNSCRKGNSCGHYTQVVWHDTQQVGCGRAVCPDKSQVWVCNYEPPGNVTGKKPYQDVKNNVLNN